MPAAKPDASAADDEYSAAASRGGSGGLRTCGLITCIAALLVVSSSSLAVSSVLWFRSEASFKSDKAAIARLDEAVAHLDKRVDRQAEKTSAGNRSVKAMLSEAEESLDRLSKDAKRHDAKLEKLLARLRIDRNGSLAVRGKLLGGARDAPRDSSVAPVDAADNSTGADGGNATKVDDDDDGDDDDDDDDVAGKAKGKKSKKKNTRKKSKGKKKKKGKHGR